MPYAVGIHALSICDECGLSCRYLDLRKQIENQIWNGLLVCPDCDDQDNPQLQVGKVNVVEGIALENPRPDGWDRIQSTAYFAFAPVSKFTYGSTSATIAIGIS